MNTPAKKTPGGKRASASAEQPEQGEDPRSQSATKSISHALRSLLMLADTRRPMSVTEIAGGLGLHKSSASRILSTLRSERFVDRDTDTGRYELGLGILSLAGVVLTKYRLPSMARRQLELLAESTGETVTISGWNGREAVNLDQFLGAQSADQYSPPGRVNPAHCTATGKVFLAFTDEDSAKIIIEGTLARFTRKTLVTASAVRKAIAETRRDGYAVADCEFLEDVVSIAAPVFGQNGSVAYVIAITLPAARFDREVRESLVTKLRATARGLSMDPNFGK